MHGTLLESIPLTYELLVGPLTQSERDRYCAEAAIMEPLLGMPAGWLPRSSAQLNDYMRDMFDGGRIAVSLLPGRLAWRFAMIEPYGFIILLFLLFSGVLGAVLSPFIGLAIGLIDAVFNFR